MTKQVQRRRGTATQHTSFTGAEGELSVNTTNKSVHVHDGVTTGGIEAARADMTNVSDADLNARLTGNTLSALTITSADINGGTIDGAVIGGASAAAVTGTTITGSGFVSTGNMTFGDNNKAIFGAGSDLQIYHDGANSYVSEAGVGALRLQGTNLQLQSSAGVNYLQGINNDRVDIYHNGSVKLATTSTGVDVTGTVTADGLTVDNNATHTFVLRRDNSSSPFASIDARSISGATTYYSGTLEHYNGQWRIQTQTTSTTRSPLNRATFDANGDISFYEDTGTTPKLFWDASAEALGIGTSSPSERLDIEVSGASSAGISLNQTGTGGRDYRIASTGSGYGSTGNLIVYDATAGSERLRIDASGNVLVGKTSSDLGATAGIELNGQYDVGYFTRSAEKALVVNRLSTDGTIQEFRKDGTTVGSIGSYLGAYPYIISSTNKGLVFGTADVNPCGAGGVASDAEITLGASTRRFKDLYLSGGVYLGGTGAANLLDDYEEGTWTPTVSSGTVSSSYGRYTKIGNRVFVGIEMGGFSDVGSANALTVNNLPFTTGSGASEGSVGGSFSRYCSPIPSAAYTSSTSTLLSFYVSGGSGAYYLTLHSHLTSTNARFYVHATYLTA